MSTFRSLLFTVVAAGCIADDDPATTATDQPLNGTANVTDPRCAPYRSDIEAAVVRAADQLGSASMYACMRQAIWSYTGSFPELALKRMREDMPTTVLCDDLTGANARAEVDISNERLTFDRGFLATNTIERIASVLLHEVAHNKGFEHANAANNGSIRTYNESPEYGYTVPEQIERCSLTDDEARPNGPRRDDFRGESSAAPVGSINGGSSAFIHYCPQGQVAAGLRARAATYVDAVALTCRVPNVTTTTALPLVGGTGGTLRNLTCPDHQVLIGIRGRAHSVVEQIEPVCSDPADVAAGGYDPQYPYPPAGGSGGTPFLRLCPRTQVVRGLTGLYGTLVDRIQLECQELGDFEPLQWSWLPQSGGSGGSMRFEHCAGRAALSGLTYHTDSSTVHRLGALCSVVSTSCANGTCSEYAWPIEPHMLPAHGGTGGQVAGDTSDTAGFASASDRCGAGAALVGLNVKADGEVRKIGGICAQVTAWSTGNAARSVLPMRGGGSGLPPIERLCPTGSFLYGWLIRAATRVDAVQPLCRDFQ